MSSQFLCSNNLIFQPNLNMYSSVCTNSNNIRAIEINNNSDHFLARDESITVGPVQSKVISYSPRQKKFKQIQKQKYLAKKVKTLYNEGHEINRLGIIHMNSRSAILKLDSLEALADQTSSHVLCVSETWYRNDIHYKLMNYENMTSKSSVMKNGAGGAAIYVRRDIVQYFKMIDLTKGMSSKLGQIIGIESAKLKLKIYSTYRSPSMKSPTEIKKYLADIKTLKFDEEEYSWVFCGDINMPTAYGANAKTTPSKTYRDIHDYFVDVGSDQLIDEPTHRDGNTLDVYLVSPQIDTIHSKAMPYTSWKSDHFPIHMVMNLEQPMYREDDAVKIRVMNLSEADFDGYRKSLRENKSRLMSIVNDTRPDGVNLDVNEAALKLNEAITEIFENHVEFKWIYPEKEKFSKEVRDQIKILNEVNLFYHRRRHEVRKESKKLSRLLKIERREKAIERLDRIRESNEPLYRYFDKARSGERRVGPFVNEETGELTEDTQEAVDLLCEHFKLSMNPDGIITVDPNSPPDWWEPGMDNIEFDYEIEVTETQVRLAMSHVRRKVGKGPDNISGYMIKEGIDELVDVFRTFFHNMVKYETWPECYKDANVVPIPKPGRKDLVSNTRPISLTSVIGKIFERLLAWNLLAHLKLYQGGKFDVKRNQFGFCESRSVNDNLTEVLHRIYTMLNAGKTCELAMFDLSRAFDKMHFNTYIKNLQSVGIVGKRLNLWKSWLCGRVQRVKVGNTVSATVPLTSGCIQGSVVGPSAFIFYVNSSIPPEKGPNNKYKHENTEDERYNENQVEKEKRLINEVYSSYYADDKKILSISDNSELLQQSIDNFVSWVDDNKMALNVSKCCILYLGGNRNPQKPYYIKGIQIAPVSHCRDLGLEYGWFNGTLSFEETKKKRFAKCSQIARLARSIVSVTNDTLAEYVKMWNCYVFPQIYTFSEFFFFESVEECKKIDNIYKDFFSNLSFSVADVDVVPYPPSVLLRKLARIRFWRVAQGLTGVDPFDVFTFLGNSLEMKKERRLISVTRCARGYAKFSWMNFCFRYVEFYNSLPRSIGRSWQNFSAYISDPNYVFLYLFTDHAREVRDKLVNGELCNIRKRRIQHIKDAKREARENYEAYVETLRIRFGEKPIEGAGIDSDVSDDPDDDATYTINMVPQKTKQPDDQSEAANFAAVNNQDKSSPEHRPFPNLSSSSSESDEESQNFDYYKPLKRFEDASLPLSKIQYDQVQTRSKTQVRIVASNVPGTARQRDLFRSAVEVSTISRTGGEEVGVPPNSNDLEA